MTLGEPELPQTTRGRRVWAWSGLLAVAALLGWSQLATAWLGDDAYISLRTIDNWLGGHGLRWNAAERTQTYTHPLWLFWLAAPATVFGTGYATVVAVGLATTAAAIAAVASLAGSLAGAGALLLLWTHCRCLVDYGTSGLENPLTHLLLAALAWSWLRTAAPAARCWRCAAVAGLCLCNRIDLLWLCLPVLVAAAAQAGWRRAWPSLLVGLSPFAFWTAFATFYYGTPLPVTAHAKALSTGIPAPELAVQGLRYVADFPLRDPTAAAVLSGALAFAFARAARPVRPLLLGALLYSAYVVKVGGDFMTGRFFTAPLVLALGALLHGTQHWSAPRRWLGAGALAALSFLAGMPPYAADPRSPEAAGLQPLRWGICDERRAYAERLGLWSPHRVSPVPAVMTRELAARGEHATVIWVDPFVGVRGYLAGAQVHLVDPLLCDPLLARLPNPPGSPWRIGHVHRRIPEGYLESLASGENRIHHAGLRRYYGALQSAVRGPLWSWERVRQCLSLLAGSHDQELRDYIAGDYATPPTVSVAAAELDRTVAPGMPWYRSDARVVQAGGLEVVFAGPVTAPRVELLLDAADRYRVQFRAGEAVLDEVSLASARPPNSGTEAHTVAVADVAQGFDRIRILAEPGVDFVAAVAALRLGR